MIKPDRISHFDNFREVASLEEANRFDLSVWTFVKFSESRDKYIFKRRQNK